MIKAAYVIARQNNQFIAVRSVMDKYSTRRVTCMYILAKLDWNLQKSRAILYRSDTDPGPTNNML
jgi:hypothetical protein